MAKTIHKTRAVPSTPAVRPVAIVVSLYTRTVTDALLVGARTEYASRGGQPANLAIYEASGAFEVVPLVLAAAMTNKFAAVVALACIIKGETSHDQILGHAVTQGLVAITLQTGVPVGLGVLTVDTPAQAEARAGGTHGNKGQEAMAAALDTALQIEAINSAKIGSTRANLVRNFVTKPLIKSRPSAARVTRSLPDKARRGGRS